MPLSSDLLISRLWNGKSDFDLNVSLAIVPPLDVEDLRRKSSASIDLRLGRWFRTMRPSKITVIEAGSDQHEEKFAKEHYVRFNDYFVLHPGQFVIGNTLEWLRFPNNLSGYVTGKSSWGRRGLIIETAAGIHPAFTGCLTLEFANVGSAPIKLQPGMEVCQVFVHRVEESSRGATTQFVGFRKPSMGEIKKDKISTALGKSYFNTAST